MKVLKLVTAGVIVLALTILAGTAWAQSPCGDKYVVTRGDSMSKIAERCNTTVAALLDANPKITNPSYIFSGTRLEIPTGTAEQAQISITPRSGPPGTQISVQASGLPTQTGLDLGVGRAGSEYDVIDQVRTNDQGEVGIKVVIPITADPGERWVVVLVQKQGGPVVDLRSEPFTVTSAQGSQANSNYIVHPGDSLSRLARRFNTTVAAILDANPGITNPNIIYVGQRLLIPGKQEQSSTVVIWPVSGKPGTQVQATGGGFPAEVPVTLLVGGQAGSYSTVRTIQTNALGQFEEPVTIPETAEQGQEWTVAAQAASGGGQETISNPFTVNQPLQTEPVQVYTVKSGDRLVDIARMFDTTIPALIDVNPSITNPSRIFVGQTLVIPQEGATEPTVVIFPTSGEAGTQVEIRAGGFPARTKVALGVGRENSEFDAVDTLNTDTIGNLQTQINIPAYAEPGERWVVIVSSLGSQSIQAVSNVFHVSGSSTGQGGGSGVLESVQVYLIALGDGTIGCGDGVVPVRRNIEPTRAPLTTAIQELLSIKQRMYGQSGLYDALYQSNLRIDSIDLNQGVASIRLSGELRLNGDCDQARVKAQLQQTALQFEAVYKVEIFINGTPIDRLARG
jgi:LysM repeat protein